MFTVKSSRFISVLSAFVIMLTALFMLGGIEANAATVAKPVVTLSNASATSVKVSWAKASGAKSYTVYKSTNKSSGYKSVKNVTTTSLNVSSLTCGKTYYFKVKAINGKNSATSAIKSIKVVPPTVKSAKATSGCKFITVSWAKVSGATGYEVYSSTSKTGSYSKKTTTTALLYKNTGVSNGTTRYYKVRAYKTVNGKKVYGAFSSIVSGKPAHIASTSWTITQKPTCNTTGTKTNTCKYCKAKMTVTMPADTSLHSYTKATMPADETYCPFARFTCSKCGDVYDATKKEHKTNETVVKPTCTNGGYTLTECLRDGCSYSVKSDELDPIDHDFEWVEYKEAEIEGSLIKHCKLCDMYDTGNIDTTCYINLDDFSISIPSLAEFKKSSEDASAPIDKLDLYPNGVSNFEITGSAKDLTIDVNADKDVEIKLNNASIINNTKDCFDLKNKSTDELVIPEVSISAKDGTENTLVTKVSGNAIESSCTLVIKGHGILNMDTASTTISSTAKIEIKNATINIKSLNRGIDTKNDILNANGLIITTEYSNVTIKPNANVTINSGDDGIRCKNMEISELSEGDVDSVLTITAGSDGIQLEGKKGITISSGIIKITAGKYAFNCKRELVIFAEGVDSSNCKGTSGFSKL